MDLQTAIFLCAAIAERVRVVSHAWALLYYRTGCASKVFCLSATALPPDVRRQSRTSGPAA